MHKTVFVNLSATHWISKIQLPWGTTDQQDRFCYLFGVAVRFDWIRFDVWLRLDFRRSPVSGLRSPPSGRNAGSFPEQRLVIEPTFDSNIRSFNYLSRPKLSVGSAQVKYGVWPKTERNNLVTTHLYIVTKQHNTKNRQTHKKFCRFCCDYLWWKNFHRQRRDGTSCKWISLK